MSDKPDKFYLTVGAEGVKSIELSMPNSSGGIENADGSLLKKGERIWTASIPDRAENKGFTHLVNDDWEITNIE